MAKCPYVNRIVNLELAKVAIEKDISSLVEKLGSLTWWIRTLVITLIPCVLGMFGWLIAQVIK